MAIVRSLLVGLAALAAVPAAPALAASSPAGRRPFAGRHALLASKDLWATIDVCNAPDQPNVLGVRGSMPGDGLARDRMYMSFRLQYQERPSGRWVDLANAKPAYVAVGGGGSARQGGRSFQLVPVSGRPAFTMRGVVAFQWRRGGTVLLSVSRATTAGHLSLAGADPANFSAASCQIG
jgi:hypothetical protein